jgi:hypothetical protein
MKCVIGVISSDGPGFEGMKDVWKKNVSTFNSAGSNDFVELYFLEGKQREDNKLYHIDKIEDNIYSFQANCQETFKNILKKSIIFLKHVADFDVSVNGEFTFVMRSNLSTLFDFHKLFRYLHEVNNALLTKKWEYFLGGSMIDRYCSYRTYYSGTNITFSIPVIRLLIKHYKDMIGNSKDGDDIVLSAFSIDLCLKNLLMRDMMRMDFCDEITFNSCEPFDSSIFCYRFKTDNREKDSSLMHAFYEKMYTVEDIKEIFFQLYKRELFQCDGQLHVKNPSYKNTFTKPFFLHTYVYRDLPVIYPEYI